MLPAYPEALALTLAVEVPVYVATLTTIARVPWRQATIAAIGVNVVTHPLLWWTLSRSRVPLLPAEFVVCVVEWGLLVVWARRCGYAHAGTVLLAALSVAANAASTLAGLLLLR